MQWREEAAEGCAESKDKIVSSKNQRKGEGMNSGFLTAQKDPPARTRRGGNA